ncbi:hypothetical protein OBBRIDRAFT_690739, partial [Obba rivulosa]
PETGRPETSKEFTKQIHRIVLHRPCAGRQEGMSQKSEHRFPGTMSAEPMAYFSSFGRVRPMESRDFDRDALPNYIPSDHLSQYSGDLISYIMNSYNGIDLRHVLQGRYEDDPMFREILAHPKNHKNFVVKNGLVYVKEWQSGLLCILDVKIGGRSVHELVIQHAHSLLAHLGANKTLGLLWDNVWWKT